MIVVAYWKAYWKNGAAQEDVEGVCENTCHLVCTSSDHSARNICVFLTLAVVRHSTWSLWGRVIFLTATFCATNTHRSCSVHLKGRHRCHWQVILSSGCLWPGSIPLVAAVLEGGTQLHSHPHWSMYWWTWYSDIIDVVYSSKLVESPTVADSLNMCQSVCSKQTVLKNRDSFCWSGFLLLQKRLGACEEQSICWD